MKKTLLPTRKWLVAQVTAAGAWLVAAIEAGWEINTSLQILAVGIVVEAASTWLIPNLDTPGGVPVTADVRGERGYSVVELVVGVLLVLILALVLLRLL